MPFASRETAAGERVQHPRPEYPRPQFVREQWLSLNGTWEFATGPEGFGATDSGTIEVPFAPESLLSGADDIGSADHVWYRRTVVIPADWSSRRVLLNFGAIDYDTTVWVNGFEVGTHRGGFTSFSFDITDALDASGAAEILVRAVDSIHGVQPRGKQSTRAANYEAFYTRTTGIWQSVWLEPVSPTHLGRVRITPVANASFQFEFPLVGPTSGASVTTIITVDGREVGRATAEADGQLVPSSSIPIRESEQRLWSPDDPFLYDITFELRIAGRVVDRFESYSALRTVSIDGTRVLINGQPLFQRLVLDQGWYRDGLMTAPTDADLVRDIEVSLAAGFNGARLHQKVFEERFLFHADRLGYLVWAEFADWGARLTRTAEQRPTTTFVTQWLEVLERDYSHPSIVGWCPLNETFEAIGDGFSVLDDVTKAMYFATKAIDSTRPVIDASGYSHRVVGADIYDSHLYEQDPTIFSERMSGLALGTPYVNVSETGVEWSLPYAGQPYFCSEFGGIKWSAGPGDAWGYGEAPRSLEEWFDRFEGLVDVLLDDPLMFGYCYTQLTDVFQEQNGIYDFDRNTKFDLDRIRRIQSRVAAYESGQSFPTETPPSAREVGGRTAR